MKNLTDIIKKLPQKQINALAKFLDIKNISRNAAASIQNKLVSYAGISSVIAKIPPEDRKILHAAYSEKNGITFEDLGKKLEIDYKTIEASSNNLSDKLLVYVLKNRQKLSNKLDKIYLFPEIREILYPLEKGCIQDYFSDIFRILESNDFAKYKNIYNNIKKDANRNIINFLYDSGGLIFLNDINAGSFKKNCQKILSDLARKKYVHVLSDLNNSGKTLVMLDKKIFIALLAGSSESALEKLNIHNRYNLLLNLLQAFDAISTYGLFLTKQNVFRKIDRKRLENSMIDIVECDGRNMHKNSLVQLLLYIFNILNIISIHNDAVVISLRGIKQLLDNPFEWLLKIIKYSDEPERHGLLLKPPFEIPGFDSLISVIRLLEIFKKGASGFLETVYYTEHINKYTDDQLTDLKGIRHRIQNDFRAYIRFLCITGIVDFENNSIVLSDIGLKIAEAVIDGESGTEEQNESRKEKTAGKITEKKDDKKIIYLNSDFSMIIPKKDIPSEALYHLLTHTEIMKDDIILNAIINRESILKSLKRGMENEKFFSTLNKYLKNEIPGNLKFLISEWLNQTIRVNVFNATILKTDPSFIDKITHSKVRNSIIKRISQEYVIIDRRYIDKVVKFAKENDAVINLFDESEE